MEQDQPKGLKTTTIWLMASVAFFFDMLQIAFSWIGLGLLIIPIQFGTLILWFKFHGLSFLSMKRTPSLAISAFLETITAGVLPAFTFLVVRITLTEKAKEIAVSNTIGGKILRSTAERVDNKNMKEAA